MNSVFPSFCNNFLGKIIVNNYKYAPYKCICTSEFLSTRKKSIEESLGIQPRPKKPLTVFLRFSTKMRPKILQENPHASLTEIAKLLSEKWKEIDPKVKDELHLQYKNDVNKYLEDCIEYDKSLTTSDKIELMKAKETEKIKRENKAIKKENERLGIKPRPKKPPSVYLRFCNTIRPHILQEKPKASVKEQALIFSEKWKKIDTNLKQKLQEEYKNLWMKYLDEIKKYDKENTMVDKNKYALKTKNEGLIKKKERELLGYPKKPLNSFLLFMKDRASQRGQMSFQEWRDKLCSDWKSISESEKESYILQNRKELEEYKVKLEKWNKVMKEKGFKDDATQI